MRYLNHNKYHTDDAGKAIARWWQSENGINTVFITCPDCLGVLTPHQVSKDGVTEFIGCKWCDFSDYVTLTEWTGKEYPGTKSAAQRP